LIERCFWMKPDRTGAVNHSALGDSGAIRSGLEGDAPWEQACREGWEGVIAKRRDAPDEHRR
jgi:ATP-dependent DNA ligase